MRDAQAWLTVRRGPRRSPGLSSRRLVGTVRWLGGSAIACGAVTLAFTRGAQVCGSFVSQASASSDRSNQCHDDHGAYRDGCGSHGFTQVRCSPIGHALPLSSGLLLRVLRWMGDADAMCRRMRRRHLPRGPGQVAARFRRRQGLSKTDQEVASAPGCCLSKAIHTSETTEPESMNPPAAESATADTTTTRHARRRVRSRAQADRAGVLIQLRNSPAQTGRWHGYADTPGLHSCGGTCPWMNLVTCHPPRGKTRTGSPLAVTSFNGPSIWAAWPGRSQITA